jgi:glycosyltransferase involved in cell wall biosynthesis
VLQQWYGGTLVPHVRPAVPAPPQSAGRDVVVRFVGSPRGHKGLDVLRAAVARTAGDGVRLDVTADPPADAAPWEGWLGQTSVAQGRDLVATADVVALPSLPGGWSRAQLPAKLVDAMILGRAVVASDLPPLRWGLGDAGLLVPPGDVDALAAALQALRDPATRLGYGTAAHRRGSAVFGVAAVAPVFEAVVRDVVGAGPVGLRGSRR